jgi:predicted transcriptional regulator
MPSSPATLRFHGLTPEQYRKRYILKPDYPMVAERYLEQRQAFAHEMGFGRKDREAPAAVPDLEATAKPKRTRLAAKFF